MNVDDVVAAKVEAARVRIQAAKRRREELAAARRRGLAARHAQKLRNLAAQDHFSQMGNKVEPPKENP